MSTNEEPPNGSSSDNYIFTNLSASNYVYPALPTATTNKISIPRKFHQSLPDYKPTPLIPLPNLAKQLGLGAVYIKDESNRLGLPAFKILGASWGTVRAIASHANMPLDNDEGITLPSIAAVAKKFHITLFAATEGNHGRAVARMGKFLDIPTKIYVQQYMHPETAAKITNEGAEVIYVQGDYDVAVAEAFDAQQATEGGIMVQDNAFENYEEIPLWIVEGYSTLFRELEEQLEIGGMKPDLIVTPIGVGSLGHAVVAYAKSPQKHSPKDGMGDGKLRILTIEPTTAACLNHNLRAGKWGTITISHTIMAGMQCGTVSPISWPVLRDGVDASVTVSDAESHDAVQYLHSQGVDAGPCGAGTLAGLRKIVEMDGLTSIGVRGEDGEGEQGLKREDMVVILLNTEGKRTYPNPE